MQSKFEDWLIIMITHMRWQSRNLTQNQSRGMFQSQNQRTTTTYHCRQASSQDLINDLPNHPTTKQPATQQQYYHKISTSPFLMLTPHCTKLSHHHHTQHLEIIIHRSMSHLTSYMNDYMSTYAYNDINQPITSYTNNPQANNQNNNNQMSATHTTTSYQHQLTYIPNSHWVSNIIFQFLLQMTLSSMNHHWIIYH